MADRDSGCIRNAHLAAAAAHEFAPFAIAHAVEVMYGAVAQRAVLAGARRHPLARDGTGRIDDRCSCHSSPLVRSRSKLRLCARAAQQRPTPGWQTRAAFLADYAR